MKRFKKGFTLIELLVVIAIIGILATIVIINVASARGKANNTKVVNDMGTAAKIATLCLAEEGSLTAVGGATSSAAICGTLGAGSTATGNWPTFGTATSPMKSTVTANWALNPTVTATASAFTSADEATGATATDLLVHCTPNGCAKQMGDGSAPTW